MTAWPDASGSRGESRRLSREFSTVGVDIAPARLRQIAASGPASEREWVDVSFALVATNLLNEQRRSRRGRAQRRAVRWAIVAGAAVGALTMLLCLGLAFFMLTQHTSTYRLPY